MLTRRDTSRAKRHLGRAVRARRTRLGLPRKTIAHRAGLHCSYLASIEHGAADPSYEALRNVADALGAEAWELFHDAHAYDSLGAAVRGARHRAGMTQERLALESRVTRRVVYDIEAGKVDPRLSTLRRLARGLNVPIVDLLAGLEQSPGRSSGGEGAA